MILDKKLNVKIAKYNIEHYINFFDVKLGDIIEIDTELHLQSESNKKINVKCDLCEEQRYIKYQSYRKNKERNIKYPIYTCDKCSHIKLKETNKEKYGVEYYSQHEDRNEKVKNTSIERYGVDHYSKTKEYRNKYSKTCLEKFGFVNPFMDTERIKSFFIESYGVDHPSKVLDNNGESIFFINCWTPRSKKTEWDLYKSTVRNQTKQNIKLLDWDGTDFYDGTYIKDNFTLHHFENDYPTIDHKISIYDGFLNNISTHIISSVDNICWTKRIINITKNKKSHY